MVCARKEPLMKSQVLVFLICCLFALLLVVAANAATALDACQMDSVKGGCSAACGTSGLPCNRDGLVTSNPGDCVPSGDGIGTNEYCIEYLVGTCTEVTDPVGCGHWHRKVTYYPLFKLCRCEDPSPYEYVGRTYFVGDRCP